MAISLKHKLIPALVDSGDAGEISTNAWTDEHNLIAPSGEVIVGTGTGVQGVPISTLGDYHDHNAADITGFSGAVADTIASTRFPEIDAILGRFAPTSPTGPITANGSVVEARNSTLQSTDIYNPQVPPGWFTYDGVRSVIDVPADSTPTNANGFGFYIRNKCVSSAGWGGNVVGMYGLITAEVDGSKSWGLNTVVTDAATPGIITTVNRTLIGYEFDYAVNGTGTSVQGISQLGTCVVQPAAAQAFSIGSLSVQSPGLARWTKAIVIDDDSALVAFYAGSLGPAVANAVSTPMHFAHYDASAVGRIGEMYMGTNGFVFRRTDRANGIRLGTAATAGTPTITAVGSDVNVDLTLAGQGTGIVRSSSPVALASTLAVTGAATLSSTLTVAGAVNKVTITAPATGATLTIPDGVTLTGPAASGTAATLAGTETLTNKTLTSPVITTGNGAFSTLSTTNDTSTVLTLGRYSAGYGGCAVSASASATFMVFQFGGTDTLRITNTKSTILGTAALATTATDGFLYIAGGAGAPTGTPTAYTGRVPFYYDTTNNRFYVYNGAWKSVVLA